MQFTVLNLVLLADLCFCKEIVIKLEDGQVKGQVVELNNFTIDVFKGIRFGKPPIGDLRFKGSLKAEFIISLLLLNHISRMTQIL